MARPLKRGLAYFPLDTDLFGNRKILRLLDKYGCEGTLTYLAALCEIYSSEGYYVPFDPNLCFDIAFTLRLDETLVNEILNFCVKIRLFDDKLLKQSGVLSSESIQKRYREIAKRTNRKLNPALHTLGINSDKTPVLFEETPVLSEETPTKGKGKGKENKTEKVTRKLETYGKQPETTTACGDDAGRHAELQRMLEAATANQ